MGFYGKASTSKEKTEEETAKERLELVLTDLGMDKRLDSTYNEGNYINKRIEEQEGMTVLEGDIVSVDGWKFEIDRSVPKIGKSFGKEDLNTAIKIEANATTSNDYAKATITIEIVYEGEIASITINGEEKQLPEKQDGKYMLSTDVVDNGDYNIIVNAKEGGFNREKVKVSEIIKDMYIYNKADMEKFRDIVNTTGRTFKNNTVYVMDEIYLEGSSSNQWTPINNFEGTFEGNNHTIDGIYIDSSEKYKGLFKENKGTIQNLTIAKNSFIKGNGNTGGLIGKNSGTINAIINYSSVTSTADLVGGIVGELSSGSVNYCINHGPIECSTNGTGGIVGSAYGGTIYRCANYGTVTSSGNNIAGIATLFGNIRVAECYNKGTVNAKKGILIGGVVSSLNGGTVENCYNAGTVLASSSSGTVGGVLGYGGNTNQKVGILKNCYNIGKLPTGTYLLGGVVGNNDKNKIQASNNYWLNTCGASIGIGNPSSNTNAVSKTEAQMKALAATLGDAYTNDIQKEDGTWKYNAGYPILKWQLED